MMRRETELKLRAAKGRRLLPAFQRRLAAACESSTVPTAFLGLEATERLRATFFARVKTGGAAQRLTWAADQSQRIWPAMAALAGTVDDRTVVLFHTLDEFIGAASLAGDVLLAHARAVWDVVGQDFAICTEDVENGLCLEFNHYADRDEYEITAWGTLVLPPV